MPTAFLKIKDIMTNSLAIEEPSYQQEWDPAAELKRQQADEARRLLNMQPVGVQRRTNMQALNAVLVRENFTENYTVMTGKPVAKVWTFKNTGQQAIPKGCSLVRVDGDSLQVSKPETKSDVAIGHTFDV